MADYPFEIHTEKSNLIYIHTTSQQIGHTCAAVEHDRFNELVWLLIKTWWKIKKPW